MTLPPIEAIRLHLAALTEANDVAGYVQTAAEYLDMALTEVVTLRRQLFEARYELAQVKLRAGEPLAALPVDTDGLDGGT